MAPKIVSVTFDKATGEIVKTMSNGAERRSRGSAHGDGYRVTWFDDKSVRVHRLAFFLVEGEWPECQVDHINGNRADNRWVNLCKVDASTNAQNRRTANAVSKSGLLGAYIAGKRWRSQITMAAGLVDLGCFSTPEEAHAAYLKAKRELHEGCTI